MTITCPQCHKPRGRRNHDALGLGPRGGSPLAFLIMALLLYLRWSAAWTGAVVIGVWMINWIIGWGMSCHCRR